MIDEFETRVQRTYQGYSPKTSEELILFVKERVLIPQKEWERLLSGMERD